RAGDVRGAAGRNRRAHRSGRPAVARRSAGARELPHAQIRPALTSLSSARVGPVDAAPNGTYPGAGVTFSSGGKQMKTTTICSLIVLGWSAVATAQEKAAPPAGAPAAAPAAGAAGMPDMTKMGPLSRKVTKEDKKGVDELYKKSEEAWKKGDVNALAELVDFPVIMLSDDSKGEVK